MILSRRKLIGGMGLLFAAPAIVRASSLMPVKALEYLEGLPVVIYEDQDGIGPFEYIQEDFCFRTSIPAGEWRSFNLMIEHVKKQLNFPTAAGESAA